MGGSDVFLGDGRGASQRFLRKVIRQFLNLRCYGFYRGTDLISGVKETCLRWSVVAAHPWKLADVEPLHNINAVLLCYEFMLQISCNVLHCVRGKPK